jgi:ribosomal protein S27E
MNDIDRILRYSKEQLEERKTMFSSPTHPLVKCRWCSSSKIRIDTKFDANDDNPSVKLKITCMNCGRHISTW